MPNVIVNRRLLINRRKESSIFPSPPYIIALSDPSTLLTDITARSYIGGLGPSQRSILYSIAALGLTPNSGSITSTITGGFEQFNGTSYIETPFTVSYNSGKINTSFIYRLRLKSGLPDGIYTGTLTLSGANAEPFIINLSGEVRTISDLVSFYRMAGNSNDSFGTNNGTNTDVTYVPGKVGQAASFNGTTSFIELPQDAFSFTDKLSISCWVKFDNVVDEQMIFGNYSFPPPNNGNGFFIELFQSKIYFTRAVSNNTSVDTKSEVLDSGIFYHVVCIFDSLVGSSTFINKILNSSNSTLDPIFYGIETHYPTIGVNKLSLLANRLYLGGDIDSLVITNGVMDTNDIEFLNNLGFGI